MHQRFLIYLTGDNHITCGGLISCSSGNYGHSIGKGHNGFKFTPGNEGFRIIILSYTTSCRLHNFVVSVYHNLKTYRILRQQAIRTTDCFIGQHNQTNWHSSKVYSKAYVFNLYTTLTHDHDVHCDPVKLINTIRNKL